jgi:hypothetical protein
LLLLVAFERPGAQAVVRQGAAKGSWSARNSTGLTLLGTWTAVADPASGAVTGTWTLVDAKGQTLRRGAWSAAKSPAGWTGSWRASVSGSKAEYSGTWSGGVSLKGGARLADLFEAALKTAVSGNWRTASQSGSWSIRAFQ